VNQKRSSARGSNQPALLASMRWRRMSDVESDIRRDAVEKFEQIVRPAVEIRASQLASSSLKARRSRLASRYFACDPAICGPGGS
jgi:hypothetical protein